MAAVLDDHQLDRAAHAAREPLGVGRGHEAILAAGDDEDRALDVLRRLHQRELTRIGACLVHGFGMRAHAEGVARELGKTVPDGLPVEGAGERDARLDSLLVGRGARRVVTAQADSPDGDALGIEVAALLDPVAPRLRRALVVTADGDLVLRLALPGSVDGERSHAPREERLFVRVQLFFRGIESRRHDHHGAGASQDAEDGLAFERYGDALARVWAKERHAIAIAL